MFVSWWKWSSREGKKLVKQETGYNYWSDFSKQGGVESIAEVEKG